MPNARQKLRPHYINFPSYIKLGIVRPGRGGMLTCIPRPGVEKRKE